MSDEPPIPQLAAQRKLNTRLLRRVGTVVAAVIAATATGAATVVVLGVTRAGGREAVRLHTLPPGDEFASINVVSHWPSDWTAAVCQGPLYQLRTPNAKFPHALASALCKGLIQPNGEYADVTVARFPAELPMQADLLSNGYKWYAFAYDHGDMVVFAIFSDAEISYPTTNLTESPILQLLKQFGFNVYSDPGP